MGMTLRVSQSSKPTLGMFFDQNNWQLQQIASGQDGLFPSLHCGRRGRGAPDLRGAPDSDTHAEHPHPSLIPHIPATPRPNPAHPQAVNTGRKS